jgi:hypothetical protein
VLIAAATPARAEDIVAYEAEGNAPSSVADARTAALDDAFARAVGSALADLVAGDVRTARKGELDREIIGHARLWVARFTVTKDEVDEDRRELTVSVRIDRDKLRARLDELKVVMKDAATPDTNGTAPTARTVTILVRVATSKGTRANFGKGADKDVDGAATLTTAFRNAGMAVRRAPDTGPQPTAEGDYPIGDGDADALGDAAKAELVAIAGITVGDAVPVRGKPQLDVLVAAHVKLLDRKTHQIVAQGAGIAAAPADDPRYAIDRALAAAASDVLPPAPKKLAQAGSWQGQDTPLSEAGVVLVRMSAKTPFALVLAEQKYLAGAKGVRAATLRRLSPNGWVLGVATSEPVEKVAQIAKKPPQADASAAVKIVDGIVDVTLSGAP